MGYKSVCDEDMEKTIPGITKKLSEEITISTDQLMLGPDREALEVMLENLDVEVYVNICCLFQLNLVCHAFSNMFFGGFKA